MDVEGNEMNALAGMSELFASRRTAGDRVRVQRRHAAAATARRSARCANRSSALGYELLLIDHLRPACSSRRARRRPAGVRLATTSRSPRVPTSLAEHWRIEPPFTLEQTVSRLLDAAGGDAAGYRAYCAERARRRPGVAALAAVVERRLSARCNSTTTAPCAHAATWPTPIRPRSPMPDAPEPDVAGRRARPSRGPAACTSRSRPTSPTCPPGLDDARQRAAAARGRQLPRRAPASCSACVVEPDAGSAAAEHAAGLCRPRAGELHVDGPVVLVSALGDGHGAGADGRGELRSSTRAFLGCHVRARRAGASTARRERGAAEWLGSELRDTPPALAARVALTVALELAQPRLLLLDRLAPFAHDGFARWARERASLRARRRPRVVQLLDEPERAARARADRALWIERADGPRAAGTRARCSMPPGAPLRRGAHGRGRSRRSPVRL